MEMVQHLDNYQELGYKIRGNKMLTESYANISYISRNPWRKLEYKIVSKANTFLSRVLKFNMLQ